MLAEQALYDRRCRVYSLQFLDHRDHAVTWVSRSMQDTAWAVKIAL